MAPIVKDLRNKQNAQRVLIYCRSLNMCADLFAHFSYALGEANSYFPSNAEHISDNRLYGMFHEVFCTVGLGMGVNFVHHEQTLHPECVLILKQVLNHCE